MTFGLPGYQLPLFGLLGTMGPGIAAFIAAALLDGRAGLRALVARVGIWHVGLRWYGTALFMRLALSLAAFYGYTLVTGQSPPLSTLGLAGVVVVILIQVPNTLLEEIGWRGYAFPLLMRGRSPLITSLVFGTGYALWHLPYWLTSPTTQQFGLPFLLLATLIVISLTVFITWFWLNTKGSVLLAWILHLSINTTTQIVPLNPDPAIGMGPQALEVAFMILLAVIVGRSLSRRGVEVTREAARPTG